MRFTPAALVAGFAAATSAFLVPPNIPEGIRDARFRGGPPAHFKELIHTLLEQKTTSVDLACPGCPFAAARSEERNGIVWEEDVDNVIHLEFDTHEHGFNVNGHPLLPLEQAQEAQTTVIKAHQIRKDNGEQSVDVPLNFAMEVMAPIPSPHREDVSIIPVEFTVLGISGVPVKVNTISFKLIKTPHNELVIVQNEEVLFKNTPGAETCEGVKTWSLCRLKAIIMARVKILMHATKEKADKVHGWVKGKTPGCKGSGKGHRGPWGHPHPHQEDGDHRYPHRWGKHHGRHGQHRHHRVSHLLHQTFRFFIIPALLGVIGCLAASAIGMLVGQVIVFLWFRNYRNGHRGPTRVEQEVVLNPEEKNELLNEKDAALPVYEDAPKYEEVMSRDIEAEAFRPEDEKH